VRVRSGTPAFIGLPVFLPEQDEGHAFAPQLEVDPTIVRLHNTTFILGGTEQPAFEICFAERCDRFPGRQSTGRSQGRVFGDYTLGDRQATGNSLVRPLAVQLEPQYVFDHAYVHRRRGHGLSGKKPKAYDSAIGSYATLAPRHRSLGHDPPKYPIYDFAESRAGENARRFLQGWNGTLVCDDSAGYKALFKEGVREAGCMAHARRKFHELWVNHKSPLAEEALKLFGALYEVEELARELDADQRKRLRQLRSRPIIDTLHEWLTLHRQRATDGTAIARAIDYSLGRWAALVRFIDDGNLPIDNNHIENRIRPIALGRSNWLFAGSLRGGQRAAAAMSLIQSAKLNGHDPYHYLRDILERLPTHPASRIEELLPHRWAPVNSDR